MILIKYFLFIEDSIRQTQDDDVQSSVSYFRIVCENEDSCVYMCVL